MLFRSPGRTRGTRVLPMNLRTLTKRSLRFHWRSHLGVVLGAALGSAALIGALIVGDSVKGSLRERALERLGYIHYVLSGGDRMFTDSLGDRMPHGADNRWKTSEEHFAFFTGGPSAALLLPGTASQPDSGGLVNGIHIIGVAQSPTNKRGNNYCDFWSYAGWFGEPVIGPDEAWVNNALARQLGVHVGDQIVLRTHKPEFLSGDAPVSQRGRGSITLRLRIGRIIGPEHLGNFGLNAAPLTPANVFVNLVELQKAVQLSGRANLLISGGILELQEDYWADALRNELRNRGGQLGASFARGFSFFQSGKWVGGDAGARNFSDALADGAVQLRDYEVELRAGSDAHSLGLTSRRVFLDPPLVRSALAADTNAQPLLTYLANLLTVGTNATPYSTVTAAGAPWTPPGLRDDEIILNQWLADDLQAKPGDALTLVYFDPESGARLTERTSTFRVHSIVPMEMPWADRTLMPQFPGIEKAETTAEWDTAFPLVHKIRPQDDDYWRDHRGTPKAFITLAAGQKMWANRFGNLTAIRFPLPTSASNTNSNETFRAALEKKIFATLKPEELGLRFEPVREQALKAAEQSQDFGGLFIGFSLFVIVAALLLMALLFQFSLEQRVAEIGTLLALGFTPKQVRRLFLREGVALAFIGGTLGALGGIGYAKGMLHGLTTIWRDAVGGSTLKFFVTPQTLVIGLFASTLVAAFTLWLALRKQAKQPARVLLAGEEAGLQTMNSASKRGRGLIFACFAGIGAVSLIAWPVAKGDASNAGAFFGAGALLLVAGLGLVNVRLANVSGDTLQQTSSGTLALRGLSRRRSRSVATAAMLACGTFLIVSIGVFRLDANRDATKKTSGTGGFAIIGESTMPVVADLNTKAGRESFALNEADFAGVSFVQFRVRAGDEASCLNLNRAQKPRLLGVKPEALEGRFTFAKGAHWSALISTRLQPGVRASL